MAATQVPAGEAVAPLAVIDMEKMLQGDPETAKDLLRAAESPGFFHVDLRGPSFRDMLDDIEAIYRVTHDYFSQPLEVKQAHFRSGVDRGYKPGKTGESFEIAMSEISDTSLAFPDLMGSYDALMKRCALKCDEITKILLNSLLRSLGKPELESIMTANPGDSGLKLLDVPTSERRQDAPDTTHTDSGILTLLWCPQLYNQIQDPATKEWQWVEQKEGLAIANVADTLQAHTDGKLHSCVHRIWQPGDGAGERLFLSYYLRPATV